MGPLSYARYVLERNVFMRGIPVYVYALVVLFLIVRNQFVLQNIWRYI